MMVLNWISLWGCIYADCNCKERINDHNIVLDEEEPMKFHRFNNGRYRAQAKPRTTSSSTLDLTMVVKTI